MCVRDREEGNEMYDLYQRLFAESVFQNENVYHLSLEVSALLTVYVLCLLVDHG